jgi:Transposase DDE domain
MLDARELTDLQWAILDDLIPEPPRRKDGRGRPWKSRRSVLNDRSYGIELISPHRRNRKNKTQDLRRLRRYRKRWKIERLFAWLQNFRRLVVRYERHAENFLGMLYLGCCVILLRHI